LGLWQDHPSPGPRKARKDEPLLRRRSVARPNARLLASASFTGPCIPPRTVPCKGPAFGPLEKGAEPLDYATHPIRAHAVWDALSQGPCLTGTLSQWLCLAGTSSTLPQGPCHGTSSRGCCHKGLVTDSSQRPCHRGPVTGCCHSVLVTRPRSLSQGTHHRDRSHGVLVTGTFSLKPYHGDVCRRNLVTGPCHGTSSCHRGVVLGTCHGGLFLGRSHGTLP
jgi:hypothetical protein